MTVRKFLDISTGHLRPSTRDAIDAGAFSITAHPHPDGYGWFIYVPTDPAHFEEVEAMPPNDLRRVLDYARAQDCDYVLFDRDAGPIADLPWYGDSEEPETEEEAAAHA